MVELRTADLGIAVIVGIDSVRNGKVVTMGAGVGITDSLVTSPTGVIVRRWIGPIDDQQLADLVTPFLSN